MQSIVNALFGNWKTTLVGVLTAVATYLGQQGNPGWQMASYALLALLGMLAKDSTTGSTALPPKS